MGFVEAIKSCFGKYATFQGRACRSEYWFFYLFYTLAYVIASIVDAVLGFPILTLVFLLATVVPILAVGVRRLHDTDRSGWWLLIPLVPLIGGIVLLIWTCSRGTTGDNRFGSDPLADDAVLAPASA